MQSGSPSATAPLNWGKLAPAAAHSRQTPRLFRRRASIASTLAIGDCMAAALAIGAGEFIAPAAPWSGPKGALALMAMLVVLHGCLGLYSCWRACPIERLRVRAIVAFGLGALAIVAMPAWGSLTGIVAIAVAASLLLVAGHYLEGVARLALMRRGLWGAPTVVIGSPRMCLQTARTLLALPKLGLLPIGMMTELRQDEDSGALPVPVLCGIGDAHRFAGIAEVAIVAASDLSDADTTDAMQLCNLPFAHVIVAEPAGGIPSLGLHTRNLGNALGLEIRFDLFRAGNLAIKRAIDLAIAVPLAIAIAPVVALLAMAIKIADPGPAFYYQRRVGLNGEVLNVVKLRTMYRDAEARLDGHLQADPAARAEWERFFKLSADPRILPGIGHALRRFSLDELPQLWNILRGDMSLVGPRPFPDYHMKSFDPAFQALRVSVPPGLTGLWQVSARSDGDLAVQREQDLFYIRNWSIWLDLYVAIETIPAVFTGRGAK